MARSIIVEISKLHPLFACESKDKYRDNLKCLRITKDFIEATDGYKLAWIKPLNTEEWIGELVIKIDPIRKLIKSIPKATELFITENEGKVYLMTNTDPMKVEILAEKLDFPKTGDIIEKTKTPDRRTIGLGVDLMIEYLQGLKKSGEKFFELSIGEPLMPVIVRAKQSNAVVMPVKITDKSWE